MKRRFLLVMLLAIGFALPMKAQDYLYIGMGFSRQSGAVRLGLIGDTFGAEVHVKSDFNRIFKSVSNMDGRRHRFSIMGGVTYNFVDFIHFTANAGYGSMGTYRVLPAQGSYGAEGLIKGFEAGGVIDVFLGDVTSLFVGWSKIFGSSNGKFSEFTFGLGFRL